MSPPSKSVANCPNGLLSNEGPVFPGQNPAPNRKDFSAQTQLPLPQAHQDFLNRVAAFSPLLSPLSFSEEFNFRATPDFLRSADFAMRRDNVQSKDPAEVTRVPSDPRSKDFPLRIPGEGRKEDFPLKIPGGSRREEFPLRIPGENRREDFPLRVPGERQRIDPPSGPQEERSKEYPPGNSSEEDNGENLSGQISSGLEDDFSHQLPADLSSPKDIRGVAHGVFGTGTGKTLPEMIQSGRNAGLPLYVRCPICQKEFKQKSTLLQHGCIHIESRPYPCGECGKRFRQQSHLTQHLRIHTNEKPYGCLYCGRNFRQRTILNQHVRIHTGEKPYKCAQCGKDFRQKAILDQHTRTHQGDRPYCCPLPNCRRRFATEGEVKRHVENHVGPKRKAPPAPMNPSPLVKPELYLPQCYPHPGNFQQQYAMSQLLGQSPPQPTALVQ